MEEWRDELTLDMIPAGLFHEIAEAIGVQNLLKLAEIQGGTTFYLPKAESFLRPVRDNKIRAEFNGSNHYELAIKYNVSDSLVRSLCGRGCTEGQIDLDEFLRGGGIRV